MKLKVPISKGAAILKANTAIYPRYGLPEYLTYNSDPLMSPSSLEEAQLNIHSSKMTHNHYAKASMLQDLLVEFDYFSLKKWSSWVPSYVSCQGDIKMSPEEIKMNCLSNYWTVKFANIEVFTDFSPFWNA